MEPASRLAAVAQHLRPAPAAGVATVHGRAELSVAVDGSAAALFGVGETVTFLVALSSAPRGSARRALPDTVAFTLSNDGAEPVSMGTALLDGNGCAPITGSLAVPGFLQCVVRWTHAGGAELSATAAAGIEPTAIPAALPVPDDFDEFWAAQKEELAAVPASPALTPIPSPPWMAGVDCFDVQAACAGGAPVSGCLARPSAPTPGTLPALLIVHGAGVRSADLTPNGADFSPEHEPHPEFWRSGTHGVEPNHLSTTQWAQEGVLCLNINAHGVENGREVRATSATHHQVVTSPLTSKGWPCLGPPGSVLRDAERVGQVLGPQWAGVQGDELPARDMSAVDPRGGCHHAAGQFSAEKS